MLTPQQHEQFLAEGHILLKGAFSREDSLVWVRDECARAGYDVDDPQTWRKGYERLNLHRREPLADYAPIAWQASCDLMGGSERVHNRPNISLFAMNFKQGADRPYEPPSAQSSGWHKDGWHFRHFLDSNEQGLLGIPAVHRRSAPGRRDVLSRGFRAGDRALTSQRILKESARTILTSKACWPNAGTFGKRPARRAMCTCSTPTCSTQSGKMSCSAPARLPICAMS